MKRLVVLHAASGVRMVLMFDRISADVLSFAALLWRVWMVSGILESLAWQLPRLPRPRHASRRYAPGEGRVGGSD